MFYDQRRLANRRMLFIGLTAVCLWGAVDHLAWAQGNSPAMPVLAAANLDLRGLFRAGGVIGIIILALSVMMVALIIEHLISIRRSALMPLGLAEQVHGLIQNRQFKQAEELCRENPSFLGHVLAAGLAEVGVGYLAVEKSMEDASTERAARLLRKIEYLSVIGTIAPMLGLLGTVWGMIQAFLEFETKANPQVSELAPGIYKALVTTLLGLSVAVPAVASFAIFRNRIDELVAESSLMAEHVFSDFKRLQANRRKSARQQQGESS
jgi:biopolymer transport protein ExbB